MFSSHRSLVAGRGREVEVRMQAGLHLARPGFESQRQRAGVAYVLSSLSHCFFQRMLVELQSLNLVVAGSNPAGRKTVAQWLEHDVSPTLVAAFLFRGECRWVYR